MNLRQLLITTLLWLCAASLQAAVTGLTAEYFNNADFTSLYVTQTNATVDFDWGTNAPVTGMGSDTFSVRWSGSLEPRYSELYTFYFTADDGARLWVNDRLLVARTYSSALPVITGQIGLKAGERVNLRLEFIEQTGSARARLEWASASQAREVVPQSQLYPAPVAYERGSILREHWSALAGTAISTLTASTNYPNRPDGREFLLSFECLAQNWADSYGTRVSGFLVPLTNGNYTFAVAADDRAELWLSTDTNPANKQLIASVTNATAFREWTNQPGQISTPRALVAGQKYYVELLHKEGVGTDHYSVAWQPPGGAQFTVIEATYLVPNGLDRATPAQANFLDTLSQGHPRLFATLERFTWLQQQVATNPAGLPAVWYASLYKSATNLLTNATPVTFALDVRGTLLDDARSMLDRIYKLALAWRVTGDTNFPERAWMEVTNAGALTNWNDVAHFLDTAELSHTFAVAYDWMYDYWSPTQRAYIRTNLETKGLQAALNAYSNNVGWSQSTGNNWNLVCNGGVSMGALALGTDSETLAEQVLTKATASLRPVMGHFNTDNGAWYEGPGYWDYATDYNYRHITSLESALGSDFGLSKTNNFNQAGLFPMLLGSAGKRIFNFADVGGTGVPTGAQMFYYARRFLRPDYACFQRTNGSADPLGALWFDARGSDSASEGLGHDFYFHGPSGTAFQPQELAVFRSGWNDLKETFLAFKGGEMGADHGNLDAGTFVLETSGRRWAQELGSDDYALPGYFSDTPSSGTDRWDYYRMRAEGQNTLVINPGAGPDTKLNLVAPLLTFQSETNGGRSLAVIDLTPIATNVTRAWRGFQLFNARKDVLVQDEIVASTPATAWWFMHIATNTTQVQIDPDGSAVTLTQGTDRLWLKILSGGGSFALSNAVPLPASPNPAGQNSNSNYAKLAIKLTGVTNTTLAVWMKPLQPGDAPPASNAHPALVALTNWTTSGNETPVASTGSITNLEDNFVDVDLRAYAADAETPASLLRFAVDGATNGVVTLLADGHTARFTPATNYSGPANFTFTVSDQSPDARLLFHYDFEPPDGANTNLVFDRSGNARDGTLEVFGGTFALTNDTPATLGSASTRALGLFENGTNVARLTRLVATNEFNFSSNDWTFVTWVKRIANSNDDFILHLGNSAGFGPDNSLSFYFPSGANTLSLRHYINTNTTDVSVALTNVFTTNQWRHLALARAGTNLLVHVDGALAVITNGFNFAISQTVPVQIGGHAGTNFQNQRYLNGCLDDTAMFTAALSSSEVAALAGGLSVGSMGGVSATNVIGLVFNPVNDAPVVLGVTTSLVKNATMDIDLRTVASDLETASTSLRFRVTNAVNGTITLLADGHTARFTPATNFTGTANFTYTVTDLGEDPRTLLHYGFEPPDVAGDGLVTDNSGNGRDGALQTFGTGVFAFSTNVPLPAFNSASLELTQPGTNGAARLARQINVSECNLSDGDWTFAGWFQRASSTNDDIFFYIGTDNGFSGGGDELQFYCPSGANRVQLNHYNTTNAQDIGLASGTTVLTGQWHHVALTFTRTNTSAGLVRTYLDGVQFGPATNVAWALRQDRAVIFGGHQSTNSSPERMFNGRLDDLVLFTNALDAAEISQLANRTVAEFGGLSATSSVIINVVNTLANTPPTLAAVSNRVINPGYRLAITNTAADADLPAQTLTFSLPVAPAGAALTTNGLLTWRPLIAQAGTTNWFSVVVADDGSPSLSATQSFTVTVRPVTFPQASFAALAGGQCRLLIAGDAGPDYTIETSEDLVNWQAFSSTNPITVPFFWVDTRASNFATRFYRVNLGP